MCLQSSPTSSSTGTGKTHLSPGHSQPRNVLGKQIPREEILEKIRQNPKMHQQYEQMPPFGQEQFLNYCCGVSGLAVCYDPFFKHIFNPERNPERLSGFLSCILGETVRIRQILPTEGGRIMASSPYVIMDIVVELEDGSLANVEIQKSPYKFPGQRAACYSSDLVLRQYSRRSGTGDNRLIYGGMHNVYTIVILEESTAEFHRYPQEYIHRAEQKFDTGLQLPLIQKYVYIPLDVYRKNLHNKAIKTELEAWLGFLAFDDAGRVWELQNWSPEFRKMYHDMAEFRKDIREVLSMFSEALLEMDRNTAKYMSEELQQEVKELQKTVEILQQEAEAWKQEIVTQKQEIMTQEQEIAAQKQEIAAQKKENEALLHKLAALGAAAV